MDDDGIKKGPTRKGRRKIEIKFIADKSRRHITFSKRKAGIMKKAYELATLTGTQVLLLVASETGHVYTFATPRLQPLITEPEGKNLIQTCLNSAEPDQGIPPDEDGPIGQPAPMPSYAESPPSPQHHMGMQYGGVKREREPSMNEGAPFPRRPKYADKMTSADMSELPPGYNMSGGGGGGVPMGQGFPSLPPMFPGPRQAPHPGNHGGYPSHPHGAAPPGYGYPPQNQQHVQSMQHGHPQQGYMTRSMHAHMPMSHQGPEPHLADNEPN